MNIFINKASFEIIMPKSSVKKITYCVILFVGMSKTQTIETKCRLVAAQDDEKEKVRCSAPHSSTAWKIPWMGDSGMGLVHGITNVLMQLSNFTFTTLIGEQLQPPCSCLRTCRGQKSLWKPSPWG